MQKNPNEYRHSVGPSLSLTRAHVAHAARLKSKWSRSQRMKEFDCTSRRISQYTQKELEKHFATGRWVLISSSRHVSHSIQNTKHILNGGWPSKFPHSAPTSSPPAANETAPPRNSNLQGESVKQMHTEIPAFFRFRKPRNAHKQEQTGIALALFVSLKTALLLKACSLRKEVFFCKGSIYVYILSVCV